MAFRGGGARGRGRGRGGRGLPVVRDEDGLALIPKTRDGPPPLFPPIENMPMLPEIAAKDEQLVSRRRRLESSWNVSPYYIEKPKPKSVGVALEIERYSDRYKLKVQTKRLPLGSVLKLNSAYFPAELLGQSNRGQSTNQSSTAQWTLGKNDLQRLDHLASMEQKRLKDGDDKDEGDKEEKKKKEGEEGNADEEDEVVDDEDEEFGDDDYAQNFGYDDDEDYGDMDDGGGDDDGATY